MEIPGLQELALACELVCTVPCYEHNPRERGCLLGIFCDLLQVRGLSCATSRTSNHLY